MISVRTLREADATEIGPMHNHLWRVAYRGLLPDAVLDSRDDAAAIRRWARRGREHERQGCSDQGSLTHVARDDEVLLGWATVGPSRDDDAPTPTELWACYVSETAWGTGVAGLLLDHALQGPASLWVLRGNERAIAFYRKQGFSPDGTTKHDARIGADELRMTRR